MSPQERERWERQLKSGVIITRDFTVTALLNRMEQLEQELESARTAPLQPKVIVIERPSDLSDNFWHGFEVVKDAEDFQVANRSTVHLVYMNSRYVWHPATSAKETASA